MAIDVGTDPNTAASADEMGLNRWPVNRMARKMLKELGEMPDPASMYLLQLASWALKTEKTEAENDVGETVNAMTEWRPERIMNFFLLERTARNMTPLAGEMRKPLSTWPSSSSTT